jgi:hypothetical protein
MRRESRLSILLCHSERSRGISYGEGPVILASHGKINSKRCLDAARNDIQTKLRGEKATKGEGNGSIFS